MFKYRRLLDVIREEQKKNEQLRKDNEQNRADIDYIAMMCDVELGDDEDEQV